MVGLFAALTSGAIWGVVPTLYAEASRKGGSIRANFWKSLGALTFLVPFAALMGGMVIPPPVGLMFIIANMALGTGAGDYSFLRSISLMGPGKATSIMFSYVVWAALLSHVLLKEPLTPQIILGALLAVAGIWLITYSRDEWDIHGTIWAVFSSFCYTLSPIAAKMALKYATFLTVALWNTIVAATVYGVLSYPRYRVRGQGRALLGGSMGTGVGLSLYFYALDSVGVTIGTLATAIGPPISQLASYLSGNSVGIRDSLGSGLVVLGIVLSTLC